MDMYDIMYPELHGAVSFWCSLVGIEPIEIRERMFRYNSRLSFYIFEEENAKHNRLHFHAKINNEKVASVYLDNLEVDFMNGKIKASDKKIIVEWVERNSVALQAICKKNGGGFEIPFQSFVY